ncbi:MAG TPA: MBOAT family O-acyltransferase [Bacteriovoracaceae bacterium]|nr:MBOAT family O-acyltransferase [Bacteriovoracaceae bacterium]
MNFHQIDFLIAFPVFFVLYWLLPYKFASVALIVFNVIFYASWGGKFFLVILGLTCLEWIAGLGISRIESEGKKNLVYFGSLSTIICTLICFKYFISGDNWFLPVGLSYQVLMGISHLTDLRYGGSSEVGSFRNYFSFKTFFPVVVSGPITRFSEMEKYFSTSPSWKLVPWREVILLFSWGYFKKAYCGDYLANEVITPMANMPSEFHISALYLKFITMPVQLYCDFSGYSSMARALAMSLGKDLPINFNLPFLSNSFNEFWNRWHISLSQWLRDYIFFPLNKLLFKSCGPLLSAVLAILLTWILGGMWHGPGIIYTLYGLHQGLYVAVNALSDYYKTKRLKRNKLKRAPKNFSVLKAVFVFILFGLSILLFMSPSLNAYREYLALLVSGSDGIKTLDWWHPLFIFAIIIGEHIYGYKEGDKTFSRLPIFFQGAVLGLLWVYIILIAPKNYVAFIYFKF